MKAIIYKKSNNEVYDILENVAQVSDTGSLDASGSGHRGINPLEAGVLVVADETAVRVGDVIEPAIFEDIRDQLTPTQEQTFAQTVAQLTLGNADLKQQVQTLAQTIAVMQIGG